MKRQSVLLTVWLVLPFLALAAVIWAISYFGKSRIEQAALNPQVGAGANSTGGVNAIGEMLAGNNPSAGIRDGSRPEAAPGAEAAVAAEPRMVHPETLDTGVLLIVKDRSGLANPSSPIYLAGTLNGWNPKDENFKLSPQSDMRWRLLLPKQSGPVEFKFTRGSWKVEELRSDMSVPANRFLDKIDASTLKPGEPPQVELEVAHWGDERPEVNEAASNPYASIAVASGTLKRLQVQGGAGGAAGLTREVLVWLPPGYDAPENASRTYPVIYMQDGQNLFAKHSGIPAEWGADETAGELISRGEVRPFIIVGVPHGGDARIEEYVPPVITSEGPAKEVFPGKSMAGDAYLGWLVREVMPRVQRNFRISPGPENTAIGGSSLGGLISIYAATRRPDLFGLVLAESPTLGLGGTEMWKTTFGDAAKWPQRIYIGVGENEVGNDEKAAEASKRYAQSVRNFSGFLDGKGYGPDRKLVVIEPGAVHSEGAWAKRLGGALRFLFPLPPDASK